MRSGIGCTLSGNRNAQPWPSHGLACRGPRNRTASKRQYTHPGPPHPGLGHPPPSAAIRPPRRCLPRARARPGRHRRRQPRTTTLSARRGFAIHSPCRRRTPRRRCGSEPRRRTVPGSRAPGALPRPAPATLGRGTRCDHTVRRRGGAGLFRRLRPCVAALPHTKTSYHVAGSLPLPPLLWSHTIG